GAAEVGTVGEVEVVSHLFAGITPALVQLQRYAGAGQIQLFLKTGTVLVQLALEGGRAHSKGLGSVLQSQRVANPFAQMVMQVVEQAAWRRQGREHGQSFPLRDLAGGG